MTPWWCWKSDLMLNITNGLALLQLQFFICVTQAGLVKQQVDVSELCPWSQVLNICSGQHLTPCCTYKCFNFVEGAVFAISFYESSANRSIYLNEVPSILGNWITTELLHFSSQIPSLWKNEVQKTSPRDLLNWNPNAFCYIFISQIIFKNILSFFFSFL